MKEKKIVKKPVTRVHSFRCTQEEHDKIKALAKACGLSVNRYMVETALKHHPRQRMTKEEVDALNSLALARADLIKISNVLRKKTDKEKVLYFRNSEFMRWWIEASAELIEYWYNIEENITSPVLTKSKEQL